MKTVPLLNFEETFARSINPVIIPCNVSTLKTKKQSEEFIKYIFTEEDITKSINITCDCGESIGAYLLGSICPNCKTIVREPDFLNVGYKAWLEIPDCLPPLMQPAAYHTLSKWVGSHSRVNVLDMLLGKDIGSLKNTAKKAGLPPAIEERFEANPWYFYNNFDAIMEFFLTTFPKTREYSPNARKESNKVNNNSIQMREYLKINRKAIFTRYFPALDSSIHLLSREGTMTKADAASDFIFKMAIDIANANLRHSLSPTDTDSLKFSAFEIVETYAKYADTILDGDILKKYGLIRRHIMGARCHFTARGVISPITDLAMPDEIYLPWTAGVLQFKLEILNLLVNRYGVSPREATIKHERAIESYDEEVDAIFQTLIDECPYKGLPAIIGRNPRISSTYI